MITNEVCDQKWEDGSGRVGLIKESHICVGNGLPEGACNVSIIYGIRLPNKHSEGM